MVYQYLPYGNCVNTAASIAVTSTNIVPATSTTMIRTMLCITNTSPASIITVSKGDNPAVADQGIRLLPNGSYVESSDSGFMCWQGSIQGIADVAGTVAIVEQFEVRR